MSTWKEQSENIIKLLIRNKKKTFCLCAVILLVSTFLLLPREAEAAGGTVYACTINRCYRHPVSGIIEDSGGEAAYTTGQGMVEGCIADKGMLEVTDDGHYYLTIRMGLVDYTTDQAFQVQSWGSSAWNDPPLGVTGQGSDSNGTTYDITMEVPGEQCVVRGSMYVQPMGRSVIYYLYPSDFVQSDVSGANGMTATMVTEASGSAVSESEVSGDATTGNTAAVEDTVTGDTTAGDAALGDAASDTENASDPEENTQEDKASSRKAAAGTREGKQVSESGEKDADPSEETSAGVDTRAGLNLSTEPEAGAGGSGTGQETVSAVRNFSMAEQIFINIVSGVIVGLILLAAAACIVYYFRKNWKRWGGEDEDDYSHLYEEEAGENGMTADDTNWFENEWEDDEEEPYIFEESGTEKKPFADEEVSE